MKIKIKFFARFAEILPEDNIFEYNGENNVFDAIKAFCTPHSEGYKEIFKDDGDFQDYVLIMHNLTRISAEDAKVKHLYDGDEIAVYPPVAGG